jgi:hypothetical protein
VCALAGHTDLPSSKRNQSYYDYDRTHEYNDYITKCENMKYLFLESAASVRNASFVSPYQYWKGIQQDQPRSQQYIETILGQAVSRASYDLVIRLITDGAYIHQRQEFDPNSVHRNATALHIASGF